MNAKYWSAMEDGKDAEIASLRAEVERLTRERDKAKADAAALADSLTFQGPMIPTSHAEKVLVAVAKEAAMVGAKDMKAKCVAALENLVAGAQREIADASDKSVAADWRLCEEAFRGALSDLLALEITP